MSRKTTCVPKDILSINAYSNGMKMEELLGPRKGPTDNFPNVSLYPFGLKCHDATVLASNSFLV